MASLLGWTGGDPKILSSLHSWETVAILAFLSKIESTLSLTLFWSAPNILFPDLESTSASEQSAVRLAGDFLLILFS